MTAPELKLFTEAGVLFGISTELLRQFFGRFVHLFPSKNTAPFSTLDTDCYYQSLANIFRGPNRMPKPLLEAMAQVEQLAAELEIPGADPHPDADAGRLRQAIGVWLLGEREVGSAKDEGPKAEVTCASTSPLEAPCPTLAVPPSPFAPSASPILPLPSSISLPHPEPWHEPVNAPETFAQAAARFAHYICLPPGAADVLALFCAHTHAFSAFSLTPRLNLYSPERGCGKTTTLDVLATMVARPFRADNIRPAVLFRVVDQQQPTLLLDEVDTYLHQADELRGLLNAGHRRASCVYRCEGGEHVIRAFKAFSPAVLAGIGQLPSTLEDRSILIPLVKPPAGQRPARFYDQAIELEKGIARKFVRWAADHFAALAACDPALPPNAFNRLADNWRPLFAIAQVVGGDWPERALAAFNQLTTRPTPQDICAMLRDDIRDLFTRSGEPRLLSTEIVDSLRTIPNRPWSLSKPCAEPLTPTRLARYLLPLGIQPKLLRTGQGRGRGYDQTDFALPQAVPASESAPLADLA